MYTGSRVLAGVCIHVYSMYVCVCTYAGVCTYVPPCMCVCHDVLLIVRCLSSVVYSFFVQFVVVVLLLLLLLLLLL